MTLLFAALTALAVASIGLMAWQAWRGDPVHGIPSLAWAAMIVVPFLAQWGLWQQRGPHGGGILVTGLALLLADALAARHALRGTHATPSAAAVIPRVSGRVLVALASFTLAVALLHLYLAPNIPALQPLLQDQITGRELMVFRENAGKLLPVPRLLKYLFNWLVTVFSTLGIVALVLQRRYWLAGVWYILAYGYAAMTSAKWPVFMLTLAIAGGVIWYLPARMRRRVYAVAMVLFLLLAAHTAYFMLASPESRVSVMLRPERHDWLVWEPMRTFADLWRLKLSETAPITEEDLVSTRGEYFLYRVLLTPVEVSGYWYAYYSQYAREGWQGILPWSTGPEFVHPARKVGLWAYRSRFPDHYGPTINAYASADADAYAHFGWLGIVVAALLLFGYRMSLAWLGERNELTRSFAAAGIVLFALLVPQASVQAMLVAQGLLFYPAALWLARRIE